MALLAVQVVVPAQAGASIAEARQVATLFGEGASGQDIYRRGQGGALSVRADIELAPNTRVLAEAHAAQTSEWLRSGVIAESAPFRYRVLRPDVVIESTVGSSMHDCVVIDGVKFLWTGPNLTLNVDRCHALGPAGTVDLGTLGTGGIPAASASTVTPPPPDGEDFDGCALAIVGTAIAFALLFMNPVGTTFWVLFLTTGGIAITLLSLIKDCRLAVHRVDAAVHPLMTSDSPTTSQLAPENPYAIVWPWWNYDCPGAYKYYWVGSQRIREARFECPG